MHTAQSQNSRPVYSEPAREATRNCFRRDASAPCENMRRRVFQLVNKKKKEDKETREK
jgi:hypothetical protein